MNMRSKNYRQRRRGLALAAILLMLTVLALMTVMMAAIGSQNQLLARAESESDDALYAAEAGLTIGVERYLDDNSYKGNSKPEPIFLGSKKTYVTTIYKEKSTTPEGIKVPQGHIYLQVTGFSDRGRTRKVAAMLSDRTLTEAQDNAVLAGKSVTINEGQISLMELASGSALGSDSPTSPLAPPLMAAKMSASSLKESASSDSSGQGNGTGALKQAARSSSGIAHVAVASGQAGAIKVSAGAGTLVEGDLRIPVGSSASTAVDAPGSNHGAVDSGYVPPSMVSVRLPLTPGNDDFTLNASTDPKADFPEQLAKAFKLSKDGTAMQLKPGAYGDVVIDGGVLELNTEDLLLAEPGKAPKDTYVFRSLTLKNGGRIALRADAKNVGLTSMIYIDEKFEITDGSIVNETLNPGTLQVYVSDNAPVFVNNQSESYHTLYAPGSDVKIWGADLYGAVVGQSVTLEYGAHIFYDPRLASVRPDPWANGGYYTVRKSYRRD